MVHNGQESFQNLLGDEERESWRTRQTSWYWHPLAKGIMGLKDEPALYSAVKVAHPFTRPTVWVILTNRRIDVPSPARVSSNPGTGLV